MSTVDVATPETQSVGPEWSFAIEDRVAAGWDWSVGPPNVRLLRSVRQVRSSTYSRNVPVHAISMTTGDELTLESGLEHQLSPQVVLALRVALDEPCTEGLFGDHPRRHDALLSRTDRSTKGWCFVLRSGRMFPP